MEHPIHIYLCCVILQKTSSRHRSSSYNSQRKWWFMVNICRRALFNFFFSTEKMWSGWGQGRALLASALLLFTRVCSSHEPGFTCFFCPRIMMIMGRVRRKILVGCVKVERNCCDKWIIEQVENCTFLLLFYLEGKNQMRKSNN